MYVSFQRSNSDKQIHCYFLFLNLVVMEDVGTASEVIVSAEQLTVRRGVSPVVITVIKQGKLIIDC